jgi:hypothetical protein
VVSPSLKKEANQLVGLARNARFLLSVVEGSGEAGVVFCDLPTVPAGPVDKFLNMKHYVVICF